MKSTKTILYLAACYLLAILPATAQTVWNGSVDDNWSSASNWNSALSSPSAGNLTFSGTANQTNTNDAGVTTIGTLTLSNGGWDIDLNGTVTMNAITATGSSILRDNVTFANGSPRTITLNGTSTTLEITGQLNLSRANNVLDLQVNGAGNTLLVGSLTMGASGGNKTISGTANVTVTGAVTESMNATFVKNGAGTLTFNGAYTSNSPTTVNDGTLFINGNASAATGAFTVNGGTLGGIGTIGGASTIGSATSATLAAGQNGVGKLTFTSTLTLTATTATTEMEIDGLAGAGLSGGHDFVDLTGAGALGVLAYGGALNLNFSNLFGASASWDLFDFASETGTFNTITLADQYTGSLLDGDLDGIWELDNGTEFWTFTESTGVLDLTVIPEPAAAMLSGLGLLLLLRRRRSVD